MKNRQLIGLMWLFALLPLAAVALCWGRLPAQVPTNWGFDGQVTYSAKGKLWLLAALGPGLAALFQFLPRLDPKRANYRRFQAVYDGFGVVIPLFVGLMMGVILVEALWPGTVAVSRVVTAALCVLFVGIGCIMGKVKTNWFMGFRTPWTLSDPDVWNRTQRAGGWLFFLVGLANLPLALLAPEKLFLVTLLVPLLGGVATLYYLSWKWYRDKGEAD